jgi:hypothetical protein
LHLDENMAADKGKGALGGLGGPMMRARVRKSKEALHQLVSMLLKFKPNAQGERTQIVNCIQAQMEAQIED